MDKLKEILSNKPKELKVLDIGTGAGYFVEVLQESLPGYSSIIGIDMNKEALNKAAETYKDERIKFMYMDGEKLEFESNSMDLISISNTLHHLPNKENVLSEMKRVLKTDGIIIINEMICDNQSDKQQSHVKIHHLFGELDTINGICHNKTYTEDQLLHIIDDSNLEKVDMFHYNSQEEQEKNVDQEEEKEILDNSFQSLESRVRDIKDDLLQKKYQEIVEGLKGELYQVGFFGATELMIICKKI